MFSLHTEKGIDYFLAPPKKLSSRECQCPRIALICMLRRRRRSTRNESDSGSPLDLEASRYRPTWANTLHLYGTFRRKVYRLLRTGTKLRYYPLISIVPMISDLSLPKVGGKPQEIVGLRRNGSVC